MEAVLLYALVAVVIIIMAAAPVISFVAGFRARYLNDFPFLFAAVFVFIVPLAGLLQDWMTGETDGQTYLSRLIDLLAVAASASAIWLIGFFAGRVWKGRRKRARIDR